MQIGSSVVGIAVLGIAAVRWYLRQPPSRHISLPRRHRAVVTALVASGAVTIALLNPFRHVLSTSSRYNFVVLSVVALVSTAMATLTIFGVLLRTTGLDALDNRAHGSDANSTDSYAT